MGPSVSLKNYWLPLGWLLILSTLTIGCGSFGFLSSNQVEAQEELALTVTPEKSQLLVGEPLKLQLEVSNSSSESVTGELDL
ncbi:MAG: hypothetical protein ACE5Q6_21070, partial [Dehalococcoidia bacterium]